MRAVTLHQPWATLIALGVKRFETRSWPTRFRGPLAIHAGKTCATGRFGIFDVTKKVNGEGYEMWAPGIGLTGLPSGAVVATCRLEACLPMVEPGQEPKMQGGYVPHLAPSRAGVWCHWKGEHASDDITDQLPFGDFASGRFGWLLTQVDAFERPVPARGMQGIWNWDHHPGGSVSSRR